jgi:hypothetical protein
LAKKIFFTCSKIKLFPFLWYFWLQKMVGQTKLSPSSFGAVVGSGICDPRSGMDKKLDPG